MKSCIEELAGSDFQIVTDIQKALHGRQRTSGSEGLDVAFIFAKIQTHLIFRYILFIRSSVILSPINFFSMSSTSLPTSSFDFKLFTYSKLRNKIEIYLKYEDILRNITGIYCYIPDYKKKM